MERKLLLMLDEFPILERLDFFESALAFMAGYGIRAYLIAQSLNQIEHDDFAPEKPAHLGHTRLGHAAAARQGSGHGVRHAAHPGQKVALF